MMRRVLVCGGIGALLVGCGGSSKPVPRGFVPHAFSAVGGDLWVLGTGALLHTTNGGESFVVLTAPPLRASGAAPTLVFADARNGFAYQPGLVFATHDGGTSWRRLALGNAVALAVGGGNAYAVTPRSFERSPVGSDAWKRGRLPFASDGSVLDLAARGSDVWLLGTRRGDSGHDVLARSHDRGRTFVTAAGPCYPGLGGQLVPSGGGVVWAVCPTGMMAAAARSADGGVSFTRVDAPPLVNSAVIAPASGDAAVLARNGAATSLVRTANRGASWRPTSGPAGYWADVAFTDAHVGEALVQNGNSETLWRTTDGGKQWSKVRFR
jgi:hypothetical protein